MPDSLKAQHTAHYSRGHVLMSDMGCAMASVTADSLGWHDPFGALLDHPRMVAQYGDRRYQQPATACTAAAGRPADRDRQVRPGRPRPDRPGQPLQQGQRGRGRPLPFHADHAPAGAMVELRLDMDVIVAVSTAPPAGPAQPLRPCQGGHRRLAPWPGPPDDVCRRFRPENARAHHNSDVFALC
jgi:uncharacterized protein YcgI (DUF1989 family)